MPGTSSWYIQGVRMVVGVEAVELDSPGWGKVEIRVQCAPSADVWSIGVDIDRALWDIAPVGVEYSTRVSPCIAHSDCLDNPDLGRACRLAR